MVIYNHMHDWIYASDEISVGAKLILQRLVSLSNDGEHEVFCSRESLHEQLGLSLRTVSRCFKELTDQGFLESKKNPDRFNRTRFFKITDKTLSEDPCQIDNIDEPKEQHRDCQKRSTTLPNSAICCAKLATSSIDRSKEDIKVDIYKAKTVTNEENEDLKNEWLSAPLPPEEKPEVILDTASSLETTSKAEPCIKEKSSARKERTSFSIPTMPQVVTLIVSWAESHMAKYPQLKQLDPELEAENFYSYWESRDWKRGSQKIKSLNGTVATWLINALKYGSIAVKRIPVTNDYRRTGLTRQMNQQIANETLDKAGQFADYLKEINGNNSSNQEPLKIGGANESAR